MNPSTVPSPRSVRRISPSLLALPATAVRTPPGIEPSARPPASVDSIVRIASSRAIVCGAVLLGLALLKASRAAKP